MLHVKDWEIAGEFIPPWDTSKMQINTSCCRPLLFRTEIQFAREDHQPAIWHKDALDEEKIDNERPLKKSLNGNYNTK